MDCTALLPPDLLVCGWRARLVGRHYELAAADVVLPWSKKLSWLIHLARTWSGLPSPRPDYLLRDDGSVEQLTIYHSEVLNG